MHEQHTKTGEYLIKFYNKHGALLRDLTYLASNLEHAKDIGNLKIYDPGDISETEAHYLPTAFTIDRRIVNSEEPKK